MKPFRDFLKEEEQKPRSTGKHLTHLEDQPFLTGDEGVEHVANILDDLDTMLSGKQKATFNSPKAKTFVAGKFDGAPAIIFGYEPGTRKFFVTTKSVFNKTPKINYTLADVDYNHGHSPQLAAKLRAALHYLPKITPRRGIYQGDFLFDRFDRKEGMDYYEFTPNTITYRLKKRSDQGKIAGKAKMGIVVHTKYEGKPPDLTPTPYVDTENFGSDPEVYLMPSHVEMNPENWSVEDRATLSNEIEAAKIKYGRMKPEAWDEVQRQGEPLMIYFNQALKGKNNPDYEGYIDFLKRSAAKEEGKFKTEGKKETVRRRYADLIQHAQLNQKNIEDALELRQHLANAKLAIMKALNQHSDIETYINGKKTGPEGYVAYRDDQDAVKLVDRKEFSKQNFELGKMQKPTYELPASVVMAFGRMNPPTGGHEEVINTVRDVATKIDAAHEIVLSASNDPDKNPLPVAKKVKYAQNFFPGTNVRGADSKENTLLKQAAIKYAQGYRDFYIVAGPDRAPTFRQILHDYNGIEGTHGYYNFDHINVITSKRLPGKSGTEMRNYAKKGDFNSFRQGLPRGVSNSDAMKLYNDIRKSMHGLREETDLNELKRDTLLRFRNKRDKTPQRNVRDMIKVWKHSVWPANDRLGDWAGDEPHRFKTKKGWKKYHLEQKEKEIVNV